MQQRSAVGDAEPTSRVSRKSPSRLFQLVRLERVVLAALAENELGTLALEELTQGIERIAAPGTLAAISIFEEASGGKLRYGAAPGLPAAYIKHTHCRSIGPDAGSCGTAAYRRAPVIVSDLATDPLWEGSRGAAMSAGLRACWSVPIVGASGDLLGTFAFYYQEPRVPGPDDMKTIDAAARIGRVVLERQRAERARSRELEELREAVRYRELFASILAHDLRNPLNTLLMGSQVLMAGADAHSQQVLGRMQESGARMARMIEQLLDLTRSREGDGLALVCGAVGLGELARSIVSELAMAFPDAHLDLQVSGDTSGQWDRDRLAQVLSNLIGNAIQHGEPGSVVEVRVDGHEPARVLLQTRNLGTIPPETLPSLFDPFKPARSGVKRKRGLGLGLFITRVIVNAHGGAIRVRCDAGATEFEVELPRAAAAAAAAPVHVKPAAPARNLHKARPRGLPEC
jgi:signal transduction histidine kinase